MRRRCSPSFLMALSLMLLFGAGAQAWSPGTGSPMAISGFSVDPTKRGDVLSFYNTIYEASESYPSDMLWTGNVTNGAAGTTSSPFKDDVQRRINFYRALSGLPSDIVFDSGDSANDQLAALMFSANDQISHYPPMTWTDYTAGGATAASHSNISIGTFGAGSVDAYMTDNGSNNTIVGHRRWLLYPEEQTMGTGDIPVNGTFDCANAIWVIGTFKPTPVHQFVEWPNAGFCPFPLMPARWSLSYLDADFTHAVVTMTQGGTTIPVTIINADSNTTLAGNIIGDNTLAWEPAGLPTSLSGDTTYTITVTGISDNVSANDTVTYNVTLFDPNVLNQSVTISGPTMPSTTGAAYTFNAIDNANAYDLQVSTGSTTAWNEGAEDAPVPQIVSTTTGSYPLRETGLVRTGAKAFQLTFPADLDGSNSPLPYDFYDQSFEVTRQIVPAANSQLQFYQRSRFSATTTTLAAQVSTDGGLTWTGIWSRTGVGGNSGNWDPAFVQTNVSLAAYAGKSILVRFLMSGNGSAAFLGTTTSYGFFLDDITVLNATQLVNSTVTPLSGAATSFTLNSTTTGAALQAGTTYYLQVRPQVGLKWYGYGALDLVTAQTSTSTSYSTWIAANYPTVTGGPGGDYSNDGIFNGYKYAFGLNPTAHNPGSAVPSPMISGANLVLSYTAPAGIGGVTYGAQWSTDLVTWTVLTDTGAGTTHTFIIGTAGRQRLFLRHQLIFAP